MHLQVRAPRPSRASGRQAQTFPQPYLGALAGYLDKFRDGSLSVDDGEGLSDTPKQWCVIKYPSSRVIGYTDDVSTGLAYARAADMMFQPGTCRVRLMRTAEVHL